MKPILLELEGFNSFENRQTIDFEELTSLGLFGIFGKTGSGKTSILDAITYALYAKIPRGAGSIVNANVKKMALRYIFEIKGVNAGRYEIQRTVSKSKSEDDTVLAKVGSQGKVTKLLKINKDNIEILADSIKEVDTKILEIIGIEYDDFIKTVVLPQGQFSSFLKEKNKDRNKILERIFSLQQYGNELSEKIKKYKEQYELKKRDYERELSGYEDVSKESIKLLEKEHEFIKNEIEIADKSNEVMNMLQNEIKQLEILKVDYQEKENKFSNIKSKGTEIENIREKCKKLLKFSQIQETIKSYKNLNDLIPKMREEFKEVRNELEEKEKQQEKNSEEKENIEVKIKEIPNFERQIEKFKTAIQVKESLKKIEKERQILEEKLNKLEIDKNNSQEILQGKEKKQNIIKLEIEDCEKIIEQNTYTTAYKEDIRKINSDIDEIAKIKKEIEVLEKESEKLEKSMSNNERASIVIDENIKSINEDIHNLSAYTNNEIYTIEKYHQMDERQKKLENIKNTITENKKEIEQNKINIRENEENIKILAENIIQKIKEKEKAQKEIEIQTKNNMIYHLKASLKDGDECPICKNTYHIHQENLAEILSEKADTKRIDKIDIELNELNTKTTILQKDNERYKSLISIMQEKIDVSMEEFEGEDIENELIICIKYKQDYVNYTKKEKEVLDILEMKKNELFKFKTELQVRKNNIDTMQNQLKEIREKISEKFEISNKISNDLEKLSYKNNVDIVECRKILDEIIKSEEIIEKTNEQLQKNKKEIFIFEKDMKDLKEKLEYINNSITNIKIDIEKNKSQNSIEISKISDKSILDIENLEEKIKKVQKYIIHIQNKLQVIDEKIASISQQIQTLSTRKIELETFGKIKVDEKSKCENILENFREEENYISIEEILKLNEEYGELEEKQNQVEKYDNDLREINSQKEESLKKYNEQKIKTDNLQIEKKYDENEHIILKERLDDMKKNYGYIENKLENEKLIFEKKKDVISKNLENTKVLNEVAEIEKLFKGQGFVQFLSKYQLSYVCKKASQILESISSGRFELNIDEKGEFIVSDFQNGGIRRNPDTLSGGETFLVSLSLALAVSSQIQLKGKAPLEFFFMDEGFGTLDSDTLDIALECLRRLKNDNLSIGIISHIEKIKDFVPIKLLIKQDEINKSSAVEIVKG